MNGLAPIHRLYEWGGILDTTQCKGLYKKRETMTKETLRVLQYNFMSYNVSLTICNQYVEFTWTDICESLKSFNYMSITESQNGRGWEGPLWLI